MTGENSSWCGPRDGSLHRVPAEAFALFLDDLLEKRHCLRPAILAASGEDSVDESDRSGVGGAEGRGLDGSEKDFIAITGERRYVSVRDAHAVGIPIARQMHAFHRLAEPTSKADSQNKVALVDGAHQVSDAPRRCTCENR